jgi:hypothetical protein
MDFMTMVTIYAIMEIEFISLILILIGITIACYFGLKADTPRGLRYGYAAISILGLIIALAGLLMPSRETLAVMYLSNCVDAKDVETIKKVFEAVMVQ